MTAVASDALPVTGSVSQHLLDLGFSDVICEVYFHAPNRAKFNRELAIADIAANIAVVVCRPAEQTDYAVVEPELIEVFEFDSEVDTGHLALQGRSTTFWLPEQIITKRILSW